MKRIMKFKAIILLSLGLSILGSCHKIDDEIKEPETITEEYVRIHLSSEATRAIWTDQKGEGDLVFKWENTLLDSVKTSNSSLVISDGNSPLDTWESPETVSDSTSWSHTWLSVSPHEDSTKHADFTSTRYYSQTDLDSARFCLAIAGQAEITEDRESSRHIYHMAMPSNFTQPNNQDPAFLRDYMYMYAGAEYKPQGGTSLYFKHIPATFRFVITNTGSSATSLKEVSLSVSDSSIAAGKEVASTESKVVFEWRTGNTEVSYGEEAHESIVTVIDGEDRILEAGEKYIAYAMVLPLSSDDALQGKIFNIKVKRDDSEYLAKQISAEKVAKANGNNIYNWVGGKSYTININLTGSSTTYGYVTDENNIAIHSDEEGTFTLRFEDSNGLALENFDDICTITVSGEEFTHYRDFIMANAAPRGAEGIGIYDQSENRVGTISMENFTSSAKDPAYSIGLLSDIHCEYDSYTEAEEDLRNALSFFSGKGVEMVCISGDITQNGKAEELALYKEITDSCSVDFPIYVVSGNHDCGMEINEEQWEEYIELPLVYEVTVSLPGGNDDHFLFLGMARWNFYAAYHSSSLEWLVDRLEEYDGERCFIFTHPFFPDRAGNYREIYPDYNWLHDPQLTELEKICDKYKRSIWFSGHSHWMWTLQSAEDEHANVYRGYDEDGNPTGGWCVHIPSCAHPITSDGISSREGRPKESEGAIMHVYEDYVEIQGIDLKNTIYISIASYRLNTEPCEFSGSI